MEEEGEVEVVAWRWRKERAMRVRGEGEARDVTDLNEDAILTRFSWQDEQLEKY